MGLLPGLDHELENANAHRSTIAAPAQFAYDLQVEHPQVAVTFVSVANSGATIEQGLLGPMQSIGHPKPRCRGRSPRSSKSSARPDQLMSFPSGRTTWVLRPGHSVARQHVLRRSHAGDHQVAGRCRSGPPRRRVRQLGEAIKTLDPGRALITQYPDLTKNQNGKYARRSSFMVSTTSTRPTRIRFEKSIAPLNGAIQAAAQANGWTYVDGLSADFSTHGYPSSDSWIRDVNDSEEYQRQHRWAFHPDATGQADIATHLMDAYNLAGRQDSNAPGRSPAFPLIPPSLGTTLSRWPRLFSAYRYRPGLLKWRSLPVPFSSRARPRVAVIPTSTTAPESRVHVELGPRSYDIQVVTGQVDGFGQFVRTAIDRTWSGSSCQKALVVTDDHLASLNLPDPYLAALLQVGIASELAVVPAGESSKSLAQASRLYDELVASKADRHTLIVALGGGVVGDLAGFVAATFARGLPMIMVPTTLLAQVDSSVGGKVGINHPAAKNSSARFISRPACGSTPRPCAPCRIASCAAGWPKSSSTA